MLPETTHEELVGALESCAAELLWEVGIRQPPVDSFTIAAQLGLLVANDARLRQRGRFARLHIAGDLDRHEETVGVVLLGGEKRPERRHWALAHEIGEATAERVFQRLGIGPADAPASVREQIANGIATRLLLPRRWLASDGPEVDWDLAALKREYATASHELIARRMLELMPGPIIVTVLDHGEIAWRRTNFSRPAPEFFSDEQTTWQACHQRSVACEAEPRAGAADRIRCWPVHEPGWRREILLTELPAWS